MITSSFLDSNMEDSKQHEPAPKRSKIESGNGDKHSIRTSLTGIHVEKVLSENSVRKSVFIEARVEKEEGRAVVLLEKSPFNVEELDEILGSSAIPLKHVHDNDIYATYEWYPNPKLNGVKVTMIHPATQTHIDKYSMTDMYIVEETPDDYRTLTLPYIQRHELALEWVYNILDHKAEVDRIVFEDPDPKDGFVLLPDMKWNQKQMTDLYAIAICHRRGVRSIRDLTDEHLPLLQNILRRGKEAILKKYGVPESQLRIYLHYQPSYYHLHVHFTHIQFDAPGIQAERSHLLPVIIHNIQQDPQFYQKSLMPFTVRDNSPLHKVYLEAGRIAEVKPDCSNT